MINFQSFFKSTIFHIILWSIAGVIILLFTFKAGVIVGYKKASFSYRWGESYHRNFGGPRGGFSENFFVEDFIESHGTFGQIIKIDGNILVVKGRDNVEKIIVVKDDTAIRSKRIMLALSDVNINDYIVIIGQPNDQGQIEAKLIRIMPNFLMPRQH